MANPTKRTRYDFMSAATAQFYNTTGTVPASFKLPADISYLICSHPTCTIVVAHIPPGCSEQDLYKLFNSYGQVKNAKLTCNNEAALVEFAEISTPTRLVHMAKISPFCIGQTRVRLEFSSEIIVSNVPAPLPTHPTNNIQSAYQPTRILHLDVSAADYPITVDVIKTIAQPHGKLIRIFIGKKNVDGSLEGLIEFESVDEARRAKEHLDGADIYSGCCSLTVTYSKLHKVHVSKNDTESWDYSGPSANVEGPVGTTQSGQRTLLGAGAPCQPVTAPPAAPLPAPAVPPVNVTPPILPAPFPVTAQTPYMNSPNPVPVMIPTICPVPQPPPPPPLSHQPMPYYQTPPGYGPPPAYGPPHGTYYGPPHYPYHGYYPPPSTTAPSMPFVRSTTQSIPHKVPGQHQILATPAPVHHVTPGGIGIGHATSNLTSSTAMTPSDLSIFESTEGVVLMVCNLPATLNCDHLFNILCLYGNIARIKFLKTRQGFAMVQVGNAEAADFIYRYYNGVSVFGHTIQFYHSKQKELTEHKNLGNLEDGSPVMKNYMMDPNNRFRNAIVAAKSRILEPSRTLHFFNAPINFTPEELCQAFTDCGAACPPRVVLFTSKAGQKTSLGLVEWDTLSEALEALILANQRPIHLSNFAHPFHLKLAFSPKPISTDRPGVSLIRYPAPPFAVTRPGTESYALFPESDNPEDFLPPDVDEDEECKPEETTEGDTTASSALINETNGDSGDYNSPDHIVTGSVPIKIELQNTESSTSDLAIEEAAKSPTSSR